jgi:lysozyme family protein
LKLISEKQNLELLEYRRLALQAEVRPDWVYPAAIKAAAINASQDRYFALRQQIGLPWWVIGGIHQMDTHGDFGKDFGSGLLLGGRITWEQSAVAALDQGGLLNCNIDWSEPTACLAQCELWGNLRGQGGLAPELSPYLWSGTTNYLKGQYIDGIWDPSSTCRQVGLFAPLALLGIRLS